MNSVRLRFGFLTLLLFLQGCAECPSSKQYIRIESRRLSELQKKIQEMSVSSLLSLSRQYGFSVEFTSQGSFNIDAKPQSIILKFFSGTGQSTQQDVLSSASAQIQHVFRSSGALVLRLPGAASPADLVAYVQALNEVKSVEYATLNKIIKINSVPQDPQWGELENLNPQVPWNPPPVLNLRAMEAWNKTKGSRNVVVGIIDTGIDYTHPDLADNIWTNPGESGLDATGADKRSNGIDDDGNGYIDDFRGWDFVNNDNDPMDDNFHGTHVAGTIGAVGNNGVGIVGVNWEVSLVGLKFINAQGAGNLADAVKAIEYASSLNIPITNNSWGFFGEYPALKEAIAAAGKNGMLFVAAAGNSGTQPQLADNDGLIPSYPASYDLDNIISVAALNTFTGELAPFSSFGATRVHIAAPGVDILSTFPLNCAQPAVCGAVNTGYGRISGTSMASPHVAGAAALIKAQYPQLTLPQLRNRIILSGTKLANLNRKVSSGAYLNLEEALEDDTIAPNPVNEIQVTEVGITTMTLKWAQSGDDNSSGQAASYMAKLSQSPVQSEAEWDAAESIKMHLVFPDSRNTRLPDGAGLVQSLIRSLPQKKKGYVTVRSVDNVGNLSRLGASVPFALSGPSVFFENNNASSVNDMTFSPAFGSPKAWGRETVKLKDGKRVVVFSDSPPTRGNSAGLYENEVDASLFLKPMQILFPDALIELETKLSCEPSADWAYIEYNRNNEIDPASGTILWRNLASWSSMNCDWTKISLQFGYQVAQGDVVTLRLRFKTDASGREEGWLVKNIKVLGVSPPAAPSSLKLFVGRASSQNKLSWVDNSAQESRFELGYQANPRLGDASFTVLEEIAANQTSLPYSSSPTAPLTRALRIRACNGKLCSASSPPVEIKKQSLQPSTTKSRSSR